MTAMEDLLRRTFADRERDVDDLPLPAAGGPRRPRRTVVVLAGAAAAALVLIGSAATLGNHRATGPTPAGTGLRYAPAPVVSAGGRTSGVLTWAPTWTPVAETYREIQPTLQARIYGREDGRFASVTVGRGDCVSLQRLSTLRVADRHDQAVMNARSALCRALPGGGALDIRIAGIADAAGIARRIADSVRTGRRDEVALPASLPAGGVVRLGVGAQWEHPSRWDGNITFADGTDFYIGPPPEKTVPNTTVGGRPAWVEDSSSGTIVRIVPTPALWTSTANLKHDRAVAMAAGLVLGAIPDYSWLH